MRSGIGAIGPCVFWRPEIPPASNGFSRDIETIATRLPYGSPEFLAELKKVYTQYDSELLGPPPEG